MSHKRQKTSPNIPSRKEVPQKENKGWIFCLISSKSFILLLLLLAVTIWYGFYSIHTKEIAGSDDREYASIARNIANGKGTARNFIYPVEINFFEKLPVPEFMHPPGYPLVLAGFFKLFGISEFVALLPSYFSYFLLLILLFYFIKSYSDMKTAALAALLLIFNKEILSMSLVALSEGVYTLFFSLSFVIFVKAKSLRAIFLAGVLLGISHMIRENLYPFLIPVFVYLYYYPDLPRSKKFGFFLTGLLIPLIPNMIRSLLETGSPFFSYGKFTFMAFTDKYPWLNIYRGIENPSLFEFLMENPGPFISKYFSSLVSAVEQILSVSNSYLLSFFFLEMFYWNIRPEWKRAKRLFLFLLVSQILFVPLFTFTHRFFLPFLPLMIVFSSQGFLRISEILVSGVHPHWKKSISTLIPVLFLIFFVVPTVYTVTIQPGRSPALGSRIPQFGFLVPKEEAKRLNDFLKNELEDHQIVWTDLPEVLEWEGDRFCGWVPTRIEKIYEIHKKIPVDAILLTSVRTPSRMEEEWKYLFYGEQSLPLYRNVKFYQGRVLFAKLLIRDGRE